MTIKELINLLQDFDENTQVGIEYDGWTELASSVSLQSHQPIDKRIKIDELILVIE